MRTEHRFIFEDSRDLSKINDQSIHLVVTSPPYPMIEMWDNTFASLNREIGPALERGDCCTSFELMHFELDKVWKELFRILKPGGFACINIGDAARTFQGRFRLYPNHYRIMQSFWQLGFDALPLILWRKQTNAPNKFMGSGMLPAGAYITLEHEYILVFRKGPKRVFKTEEEKANRRESAFFWEERNNWFSDVWGDLKGTRQKINAININTENVNMDGKVKGGKGGDDGGGGDGGDAGEIGEEKKDTLRLRSGAFPFTLPYRLINMFSAYNDTVLDPFAGTGTTNLAALASGRNSVGYEIETGFVPYLEKRIEDPRLPEMFRNYCSERISGHLQFVKEYTVKKGRPLKYLNSFYKFPVFTKQETALKFFVVKEISKMGEGWYAAAHESEAEFPEMI